jgi:hypothetical protein
MIEYVIVGTLVGLALLGGIITWYENRKRRRKYPNDIVDF